MNEYYQNRTVIVWQENFLLVKANTTITCLIQSETKGVCFDNKI